MALKLLVLIGLLHIINVESASIAKPNKSSTNILFDDKALEDSMPTASSSRGTNIGGTGNGNGKMHKRSQVLKLTQQGKKKFPSSLDDMNQNWGILVNSSTLMDEEEIYRPINIPKPQEEGALYEINARNNKRQGKALRANWKPKTNEDTFLFETKNNEQVLGKPTTCETALILCCMKNTDLQSCFNSHGCSIQAAKYDTICVKKEMDEIRNKIAKYYTNNDK